MLSAILSIPYKPTQAAIAVSYGPSVSTTDTVYPNRTVSLGLSSSQTLPPYPKNANLTSQQNIEERFYGNGTEYDAITSGAGSDLPADLILPVGSNLAWSLLTGSNNHTIIVKGPESFNVSLIPYQSNPTHQFNMLGTYGVQSVADIAAPHLPSRVAHLYVLSGDGAEPPTYATSVSLSRGTSQVTVHESSSLSLTTFEKNVFGLIGFNSFSISGSYANGQSTGTLVLHFVPGVINSPLNDLLFSYTANNTKTVLSAGVNVTFNPSLVGTPLENQTAFQSFYDKILNNATLHNNLIQNIKTATNSTIQLEPFIVPMTINSAGAQLSVKLVFDGNLPRFLSTAGMICSGLPPDTCKTVNRIYNETQALLVSSQYTITYTKASGAIIGQGTTILVGDLDARVNHIKSDILSLTPPADRKSQWQFLNSTTLTVSGISFQAGFNPQSYQGTFSGLLIQPPTVDTSSGFQIPGLFNQTNFGGVNFTLVGGSNSTHAIKLIIPSGVPAPNATTVNSVTWYNIRNLTSFMQITFQIVIISQHQVSVPLPSTFPTGVAMFANATITNKAYDSTNNAISFTVSGPTGGVAIVNITVPKSQVSSINSVTVSIDGVPTSAPYTSDSTNYYLQITVHLSTHTVNIALGALPTTGGNLLIVAAGIVVILVVAGGGVLYMRRRRPAMTTTMKS